MSVRGRWLSVTLSLSWSLGVVVGAQQPLTQTQVDQAVGWGQSGKMLPVSVRNATPDFDLWIEGPVNRIAALVHNFTPSWSVKTGMVTDAHLSSEDAKRLAAQGYVIRADYGERGRRAVTLSAIALQPRGTSQTIRPVRDNCFSTFTFDRLPDGDFTIIVTTSVGPQRYMVSNAVRATIR
jgi:hypothetical protein